MVRKISDDLIVITEKISSSAAAIQKDLYDETTAGMLNGLLQKYQKNIRMLKSFLEE